MSAFAVAVAFAAAAHAQQAPAQGGARQIVVEAAKDAGADKAAIGSIAKAGEAPLKLKQIADKKPAVAAKPAVAEEPVVAEKPVVVEQPVVVKKSHHGYCYRSSYNLHCH